MAFVQSERGRGPRRWAWVLFAVVAAAIIWFIAGGIGNSRKVAANEPTSRLNEPQVTPAPGGNSQPAEAGGQDTIRDFAALLNVNQEQLVNHQAQLKGVNVLQKFGENAFFIGSGGTQRLLVVPQQNTNSNAIKPGESVDVMGTIRKLPDEKEAMKQWNLGSNDMKMLRDMHVYLEASNVKVRGK